MEYIIINYLAVGLIIVALLLLYGYGGKLSEIKSYYDCEQEEIRREQEGE